MGLGVVARDERGSCLGWLSRRISVLASGEMAEAWAAREAVQLATHNAWPSVIIEGDCLVLISKLRVSDRDLSPVGFSFVKRIGNSVAHAKLASVSLSEESVLPRETLDIVNFEALD
ncbi:UNVERIFIED_CONTAM: hypothetical protein Slati_1845700 [Sesamum latifolium]|uniref:RNase H type-1 domain-containing protein n=1 Tax=Sesamum latifolium TaxID=2727402 RepID=A0AAW2X046_9LAMI